MNGDVNSEHYILDVDDEKVYHYSQLFDTCFIVPLNTTKENLIGKISSVIIGKEILLVLDAQMSKAIFLYDFHGKLKTKIRRLGKGPGEYKHPNNVVLVEDDERIYIQDSGQNKILVYSLKGEFLWEKPMNLNIRDLQYVNGVLCAFTFDQTGKTSLVLYDLDLNKMKSVYIHLEDDIHIVNGVVENYLYQNYDGAGLYAKNTFSNKLIETKGDSLSKLISISFSSGSFNYEPDITYDAADVFKRFKENDIISLSDQIVDSPSFMMLGLIKGNQGRMAILDKSHNSLYYIKELNNDMDGLWGGVSSIGRHNVNANYFISIIPANIFNQRIHDINLENHPYGSILSKMTVGDFDNPILILYKIKKNANFD
ncbi:6-bladed beta-propeller protein [Marinoscillum furvescens DSM 4134]|uniref:6-bladed beta-propeller protein n=2 Tax=Marinoscillum furvescens TaxID=1026 RepID=A0A3D9L210_MARFU|nr:6-bladed beta-propeller protein [Marinoscillum furvescens DSM 4134]